MKNELKINKHWMRLINAILCHPKFKMTEETKDKLEFVYRILSNDCKKMIDEK